MRNHTPLMKTVRLWRTHTSELQGLADDGSLDLLTLAAAELDALRSQAARLVSRSGESATTGTGLDALRTQAARLVHALDTWQATHRPRPTTTTSERV
jgi:hypothetical protein